MRLTLSLALVFALAGCGDADTPDGGLPDEPPAGTPTAETSTASSAPAAAPTGTAPTGSPGTLTMRFAESDADGSPFTEVAGFLPPPVPADAYPTLDLADAPNYHVHVDKTTLPDGFDLDGTHFVYVKRDADGRFDKAQMLRGWVGLSNSFSGSTYSGTVGGFAFPPLWPEGAPVPGLTYDAMGDDKRQIGTSGLGVMARPVWAQPITLPATVEDPEVTAELDFAMEMEDDPNLYIVYREKPSMGGETTWSMDAFYPDRSTNRARERSDDSATPTTRAFTVGIGDLGDGPTEAFLLAFPE